MAEFFRGFENVDQSNEEKAFFQFLDLASSLPSIAMYRDRMLDLCPVSEGYRVLDVGCGLGYETTRIARLVGKNGQVNGVDSSASMIAEARRRAQDLRLPLTFETGDAQALPFESSVFDLTRVERVLLYLDAPDKAVAEMARVTRSGGRVVIFDFDHGAFFIDSDAAAMTRRIEALIDADPRNPAMAREVPQLMRKSGLTVDAIEPMVLKPTLEVARRIYAGPISKGIENGDFSESEVECWWQEQASMERNGSLYHAHVGYIVAATKT